MDINNVAIQFLPPCESVHETDGVSWTDATSDPRADAVSSETMEANRPQVFETRCGENSSTSFLRLFLTGSTTITSIFSNTSRKLVMPIRFSSVYGEDVALYISRHGKRKDVQLSGSTDVQNSHGWVSPCGPPAGGSDERGQSHSLCWLVWPATAAALRRRRRWAGWMSAWQRCCKEPTSQLQAVGCWMFENWPRRYPGNRQRQGSQSRLTLGIHKWFFKLATDDMAQFT